MVEFRYQNCKKGKILPEICRGGYKHVNEKLVDHYTFQKMYNIMVPFTHFYSILTGWKNNLNVESKVEDIDKDVERFLIDKFTNFKGVSTKFYKI